LYSLFEFAPPNVEDLLLKSLEGFYNKLKETNEINQKQFDEHTADLQSFL